MFFEKIIRMSLEVGYFAPHGEESHALTLSGEVFRVRLPASVARSYFAFYSLLLEL
jgi:hypothetical protein